MSPRRTGSSRGPSGMSRACRPPSRSPKSYTLYRVYPLPVLSPRSGYSWFHACSTIRLTRYLTTVRSYSGRIGGTGDTRRTLPPSRSACTVYRTPTPPPVTPVRPRGPLLDTVTHMCFTPRPLYARTVLACSLPPMRTSREPRRASRWVPGALVYRPQSVPRRRPPVRPRGTFYVTRLR